MFNRQDVNITSFNQSGGITAHTVNFTRPQRQLIQPVEAQLEKILAQYPNDRIRVSAAMNDPEATRFAQQILAWLKQVGRRADGVDQVMWNPPVEGQHVETPGNGQIDIMIGHNAP